MNPTKSSQNSIPDHTAVRVALWRAMHIQIDAPPHVFEDEIGLKLIAPDENWRARPDMHPEGTRGFRASIVGRARLIEDLLLEKLKEGVEQYVILGAGLDTFAQRHPELVDQMRIFEIDRSATQEWKRSRLRALGLEPARTIHFVPLDFEIGDSWLKTLSSHGFDSEKPAFIAATGLSMYLTLEANRAMLRQIAGFAPGSTFAMSFLLPLELIAPEEREALKIVYDRARAAGTPFLSFFPPQELVELARREGFLHASHISRANIIERYFAGRSDGLQPSSGEEILIAGT